MNNTWDKVDYFPDKRSQKALRKSFVFEDFNSALDFVNKIGKIADKKNHHPDINLSWGMVQVWLTTHSAKQITEKDYDLAKAIDQILK
jgi:4a-hydroxytetrahydrobiopterin dehydratase